MKVLQDLLHNDPGVERGLRQMGISPKYSFEIVSVKRNVRHFFGGVKNFDFSVVGDRYVLLVEFWCAITYDRYEDGGLSVSIGSTFVFLCCLFLLVFFHLSPGDQ